MGGVKTVSSDLNMLGLVARVTLLPLTQQCCRCSLIISVITQHHQASVHQSLADQTQFTLVTRTVDTKILYVRVRLVAATATICHQYAVCA